MHIGIADILVGLSPDAEPDGARDYALSMGSALGAHVTGACFAIEVAVPYAVIGDLPAALVRQNTDRVVAQARDAIARFDEAARVTGASAEPLMLEATTVEAARNFGLLARTFDVSILGHHEPGSAWDGAIGDLFFESALFRSGRPVIVVPRGYRDSFDARRVTIAWDGGLHAASAVAASLALIKDAEAVEVVTVAEKSKQVLPGADIGRHLARHGIKVTVTHLKQGDETISGAIFNHASRSNASLLVMGAYGHSRLREFVLGGVTRDALSALPLPALMAH